MLSGVYASMSFIHLHAACVERLKPDAAKARLEGKRSVHECVYPLCDSTSLQLSAKSFTPRCANSACSLPTSPGDHLQSQVVERGFTISKHVNLVNQTASYGLSSVDLSARSASDPGLRFHTKFSGADRRIICWMTEKDGPRSIYVLMEADVPCRQMRVRRGPAEL